MGAWAAVSLVSASVIPTTLPTQVQLALASFISGPFRCTTYASCYCVMVTEPQGVHQIETMPLKGKIFHH